LLYYEGDGVEQDYAKAIEYFTKSADMGNAGAQQILATAYYYGEVTEKDTHKAFYYAEKAAYAGNIEAAKLLARIYANDREMPSSCEYADAYSESSDAEKSACMALIDELVKLAGIVWKDGLLMLDDYTPESDEIIMQIGLPLIVDAIEAELVTTILETCIATSGKTGVGLLRQVLALHGVLAIQNGERPENVKEKLYGLLEDDSDDGEEGLLDTEVENDG
jgi:hypothetical protein